MQTFFIAAATTLLLATSGLSASAGTELDRAVGAGAFLHPTGPANGVWHSDDGGSQVKK